MFQVTHQGQQFGPYTLEQINEYLAQGAFDASSHVWDANVNGWVEIWQLPGVILPAAHGPTIVPTAQGNSGSFKPTEPDPSVKTSHRKNPVSLTMNFVGLVIYLFGFGLLGFAAYGLGNQSPQGLAGLAIVLVLAVAALLFGTKQLVGARKCSGCNAFITKYDKSCSKCKVTFE